MRAHAGLLPRARARSAELRACTCAHPRAPPPRFASGGSACGLCAVGEQRLVAVLTEGALCLVAPGELVAQLELGFRASCVACSPCGSELAVGGCEGELHLFALSPSAPRLVALPGGAKRHQGAVTSLAYSPAGTHLASCGADRHVYAFVLPALAPVSTSWTAHKAKVLSLAWAPSGRLLASGGVDSSIVLWSIDQPGENVVTRLAHADGVTAVGFLSDELIISAGQVRAARAVACSTPRHAACLRVFLFGL